MKLVFVQVTEPEERLFKKDPRDFGDAVTKGNGQDRNESAVPASEMNNVMQEQAEAEITDGGMDDVETIRDAAKIAEPSPPGKPGEHALWVY